MGGFMAAHVQKRKLHLQGAVGQKACKLRFGSYFGGHQVHKQNAQRPDILAHGARAVHHKNIFFLQCPVGREALRDDKRHGAPSVPLQNAPARRRAYLYYSMCVVAVQAPESVCNASAHVVF